MRTPFPGFTPQALHPNVLCARNGSAELPGVHRGRLICGSALHAILHAPRTTPLTTPARGAGSSGLHLPNSFSDTRQMMAQHGLPQGALVSSSYMQDTWNDMGDQDAGGSDWSGGQLAPGRGASSAPDSGSSLQAEDEEFNRDMAQVRWGLGLRGLGLTTLERLECLYPVRDRRACGLGCAVWMSGSQRRRSDAAVGR